jgi:hypothetical protein
MRTSSFEFYCNVLRALGPAEEENMYRSIVLILGLGLSVQCFAQPSVVGTYKLVKNDIRLDGQPIETLKSPHGYLVITPKVVMLFFASTER